jgi:uncharacterized protein (UPF0335 family)
MFDTYMTDQERKNTIQYINDMDAATKVDADVVLDAMSEGDISINLLIHINMMKCEVLMEMKKPIFPFTKEDYIAICSLTTEEERRKKLLEVLILKDREYYKMSEKEPVMGIVKESDNDPKNMNIAVDRLRSLIERIERLEKKRKAIASDIRDIFAEAKGAGFDCKIMRAVIKLRKMNAADRDEQEILLETYRKALDI